MSPHAWIPSPSRPIFIRTRRPLWQRLLPALAVTAAIALLVAGVLSLIDSMHATEARLDAAYYAGMKAGLQACPGR